MNTQQNTFCRECGMQVSANEYHPYGACLMFKASNSADQVRTNLDAIVTYGISSHAKLKFEDKRVGQPSVETYSANQIWGSVEYASSELRATEFVPVSSHRRAVDDLVSQLSIRHIEVDNLRAQLASMAAEVERLHDELKYSELNIEC